MRRYRFSGGDGIVSTGREPIAKRTPGVDVGDNRPVVDKPPRRQTGRQTSYRPRWILETARTIRLSVRVNPVDRSVFVRTQTTNVIWPTSCFYRTPCETTVDVSRTTYDRAMAVLSGRGGGVGDIRSLTTCTIRTISLSQRRRRLDSRLLRRGPRVKRSSPPSPSRVYDVIAFCRKRPSSRLSVCVRTVCAAARRRSDYRVIGFDGFRIDGETDCAFAKSARRPFSVDLLKFLPIFLTSIASLFLEFASPKFRRRKKHQHFA